MKDTGVPFVLGLSTDKHKWWDQQSRTWYFLLTYWLHKGGIYRLSVEADTSVY